MLNETIGERARQLYRPLIQLWADEKILIVFGILALLVCRYVYKREQGLRMESFIKRYPAVKIYLPFELSKDDLAGMGLDSVTKEENIEKATKENEEEEIK